MNCLFIPTSFPSKLEPFRWSFINNHLQVAKSMFCSVVVIANIWKSKNILNDSCGKHSIFLGDQLSNRIKILDFPLTIYKYLKLAKSQHEIKKFDIIFSQGIKWGAIISTLISKLLKIPILLHIHNSGPQYNSKWFQPLIRYSLKNSTIILFTSQYQFNNYLDMYPFIEDKKNEIVGNPVDIDLYNYDSKSIEQDIVNILFAARPIKAKGLEELKIVAKELTELYPNLTITILTQLELIDKNESILIENINSRVKLKNFSNAQEYKNEIDHCSFFLCLSKHESFSYVIAEAISCGKPIVSTKCGGPEDYINNSNGIIIKDFEISSIIESIKWMINNFSEFKPEKIRDTITSNYSYNMYQQRIEELLSSEIK